MITSGIPPRFLSGFLQRFLHRIYLMNIQRFFFLRFSFRNIPPDSSWIPSEISPRIPTEILSGISIGNQGTLPVFLPGSFHGFLQKFLLRFSLGLHQAFLVEIPIKISFGILQWVLSNIPREMSFGTLSMFTKIYLSWKTAT